MRVNLGWRTRQALWQRIDVRPEPLEERRKAAGGEALTDEGPPSPPRLRLGLEGIVSKRVGRAM